MKKDWNKKKSYFKEFDNIEEYREYAINQTKLFL